MSAAPKVLTQVDEDLRRATIAVLRERGWDGLTLERVAEVAGRARSTLWRQGWSREVLVRALVGELADDFRSTMYPILTSGGTGRDRLVRALEALCEMLERHLPLMLATDEAFHQDTAPGVYVSPEAIVRDSIVLNDSWIGPGAILNRVIVDKDVVIGANTRLGHGDDQEPNHAAPDRLFTGISVVGKGAHIPADYRVGRNVVVRPNVSEENFIHCHGEIPSGETV